MTASAYATDTEKAISGALALLMHALFVALLVFGVTWQRREQPAMVVDLWNNLPQPPAPKAAPPPPPKPAPEPPKPVPKAEPKPVPKVEPKPAPKADIALKEKKEKERIAREQALAEKKEKERIAREKALAEKKKREEQARIEAAKQQQAKEAEEKRLAREQEEALKKLAAQQAAAREKLRSEYIEKIRGKIRRYIVEPPNLQGNPEVEFDVVLLPGGEVLGVKLKKGSSLAAYDNAVERAILKAQPLPLPPDPAMFKEFRELNLKFRPKEE